MVGQSRWISLFRKARAALARAALALAFAFALAFGAGPGIAPAWSAEPHTLRIGTGNFPPYFNERGTDGLFNDLIREVFALMPQFQLQLVPQMSNYRLVRALNSGAIDGVANIFSGTQIQGCRTDPVFRFTDVAISRADSRLVVDKLDDLAGKRIVTYQGAKEFLGQDFARAVASDSTQYRETPQPLMQVHALTQGTADLSIGDLYIFLHGLKTRADPSVQAGHFTIHRLFPDSYSYMAFREKRHCEAFNSALAQLRKSGAYDALYDKHLKALRPGD
ncbi:ABC-type amino acid transport substrate-binding protein [Inhella inkyongensis]|uniref:ABC-type amino acid transport substrate-binding protein n=1 Tax=Inhella inkyongensis TaxID=392593 RepID=A0A840SAM9_9BURK|nr:transporter substrate-binding domain-containing protein [Inhella inkyongensis]MBB5205439.1 ABC-type amino acid transport substrate-binding protein [Inhella inkyongensis]